MANDGSKASLVEAGIVTALAALQHESEDVFATADLWKGQISAAAGGVGAIQRYAPFAFAAYQPGSSERHGDHDLGWNLDFAIVLGQWNNSLYAAGRGDGTSLGTNMMEQLVIAALDNKVIAGSGCDALIFRSVYVLAEHEKFRVVQLNFSSKYIVEGS